MMPGEVAFEPAPPAAAAIHTLLMRFAVALRTTCTAAVIVVAVVTAGPGVEQGPLVTILAASVVVTACHAVALLRRPGVRWVVYADLALTAVICLLQAPLLPPALEAQGSSWVAAVASVAIIGANLALPAPVATLGSLVVTAAWAMGSMLARGPGAGLPVFVTLVIQAVVTAAIVRLLGRASRVADSALREWEQARQTAVVEASQRLDERAMRRRLHDTALATLTVVGSGSIAQSSPMLRARAAGDLAVLLDLSAEAPATGQAAGTVRLDQWLTAAVDRIRPLLAVSVVAEPCTLPYEVADAIVGAVNEALINIAKHADVDEATIQLLDAGGGVVVEVRDAGVGFEPDRIGQHHYGLRESVIARMAEVGGWARVTAAPGSGCGVALGWARG